MNTNLKYYQLLSQIAEGNPFKKSVAAPVFDIASDFKRDMEIVAADRRLSPEGRRDKAREHMRQALRDLRDIQKPLDQYHAETKKMSAAATLPAYDKSDYVAALNRKELRDRSALMNFGQRAMLLAGPHRDKNFVDAVLEQPAWVSGIDINNPNELQIYEEAKQERLRDLHGPLQDTIAERDSAERDVRDLVISVVRNDIQNDSGLESRDFEAFAKPIESRAGAPWIMEDKKTICEVKNGQAEYHLASADELRDGREYPGGLPEYLASRAA